VKPFIHRCDIIDGAGNRTRILAVRENRRPMLADYDVRLFVQPKGQAAIRAGGGQIPDFPRALGCEGLFGSILTDISSRYERVVDENGVPVPMPITTPAQWRERAVQYVAMASECLQLAGAFEPELINPAEPSLFDQVKQLELKAGGYP
jgi:hypothetical protein